MPNTDVAIVGAGPYGLAAAAHLRRSGVSTQIYGDPMSFWRIMPIGMVLRSNWTATCIAEYQGPLSLDSFCAATGARFGKPIPLDRFIEYGTWVQAQVAPDVDPRLVQAIQRDGHGFRLTLTDGSTHTAGRVAVAAGIAPFPNRPAVAAGLPADLASHTADHRDLAGQQLTSRPRRNSRHRYGQTKRTRNHDVYKAVTRVHVVSTQPR